MSDKPLQVVGVDVPPGQTVRGAFDVAFDAADRAETLQRLDGLTKALPVAAIVPEHDYQTIAVDLANRIELAVQECRNIRLSDSACRVAVLRLLDPQTTEDEALAIIAVSEP